MNPTTLCTKWTNPSEDTQALVIPGTTEETAQIAADHFGLDSRLLKAEERRYDDGELSKMGEWEG